jgi:molecular chaperone Hsp33
MRNHPTFKSPATGITSLRDTSIAYNLALYLAESEQRTAALLTDVSVVQGRCAHALAVLMERLPGCTDEKIESAIANLQTVQQKTLSSYLQDSVAAISPTSSSTHTALDRILDDCLISMDADSIRWSKKPSLRCNCSRDRLLSALRLLSAKDKEELLQENKLIETKCEFCGTKYGVSIEEMKAL